MKYVLVSTLIIILLLSGCVQKENTCTKDEECLVPMEFAIQSNCPFISICEKGTCITGCPLIGAICDKDKNCDCTERGNRSLDCICHEYECISIEGYEE